MKKYYIFKLKTSFYKLYKDKRVELYDIYNRIYKMKKTDKEYGYNLFCQISDFLEKDKINKIINNKYKDKIMYTYNDNMHIINNIFFNEISILEVKNSTIRIETNTSNSSFFNDIKDLNGYYFVCNFKDNEYFFINKKKLRV